MQCIFCVTFWNWMRRIPRSNYHIPFAIYAPIYESRIGQVHVPFQLKKGELSCFRFRNNALLICYETVNANAYQILAKDPLELHCIDILTFSRFKHSENECNFSVSFMKCQNRISARARKTWQEKKGRQANVAFQSLLFLPPSYAR